MTADRDLIEYALQRVDDLLAAHRLQESAILGLQASLGDLKANLASQVPPEPPSPPEEPVDPYPNVLGALPGDDLDIQTMGGGR